MEAAASKPTSQSAAIKPASQSAASKPALTPLSAALQSTVGAYCCKQTCLLLAQH
jgi:hypothetical protein